MDKRKLAQRLKKGDENALTEVIREFSPVAAAIVYNISSGILSQSDIEEVLSDTFIALWYNREKIMEDRLSGYICCIAKNKARDKMKSAAKNQTVSIEDMDMEDELTVEGEIETMSVNKLLEEAVQSLEEPDREITLLHYFYYLTSAQIADKLQMNVSTVKTKIRRSREKIKKYLYERGYRNE